MFDLSSQGPGQIAVKERLVLVRVSVLVPLGRDGSNRLQMGVALGALPTSIRVQPVRWAAKPTKEYNS